MDALSDVLRVIRLTGGVFLDAAFSAPWCVVSRVVFDVCGVRRVNRAAPALLRSEALVLQVLLPLKPPVYLLSLLLLLLSSTIPVKEDVCANMYDMYFTFDTSQAYNIFELLNRFVP